MAFAGAIALGLAPQARADDTAAIDQIVSVLREKGLIDADTGDEILAKQAHKEAAAVSAAKTEASGDSTKSFKLTPGGFLEAAAFFRSSNENADMGSTYGNVPFDGTGNSHLSEFRGSARQSRLSLLAEGYLGENTKVTGYYEMDFLGAAPTANEVESNSWTPRTRQLFSSVDFDNGVSFLAGQAWSLLTTNRSGITPRQELVPATIDAQYNVGYNWSRQWQLRLTDKFSDQVWGAISLENPETSLNVVNPPANVLGFANSGNAQSPNSQFVLSNTPGANGISTDLAPDLIGKLVWEPGFGHYELKAIGRFFRDRFSSKNDYATGAGFGAAAVLPVVPGVNFIIQTLDGWGIGRYASGLGADVTLKPDGTIVPITTLTVFGGFETHPNPDWDVYLYGGMEYYRQRSYQNGATGVGYGTPGANNVGCESDVVGTCQAQNRLLWQFQPGFWYRFYRGPMGTLQMGMSYSYVHRATWEGLGGVEPIGNENIVMSSFRYYLP
ncbi:MAG TPA: hypothetical protein VMR31_00255 [Myxococcota bacterium]|nr:hypothetical protein [Myxococcota bacterium]